MFAAGPLPLRTPDAPGAGQQQPDREGDAGRAATAGRFRALIARRRRALDHRLPVSPSALNEELALTLLYGTRSGSVTPSPKRPPR
jgi:hypothetical protein